MKIRDSYDEKFGNDLFYFQGKIPTLEGSKIRSGTEENLTILLYSLAYSF
jgi:hypothetical protein